MTGKWIQQQMYTRERGGIFHDTDGYDTIAISSGVDLTFVKKYLHPFCIYHAPTTLAGHGEKDMLRYPEAMTIFQPETGEVVIGQAVFVPADFTGTRSTYFMHSYIIPKARKEEWIRQPSRLFQVQDFKTSYDIGLGKVLPEVEDVAADNRNILASKNDLLETLGLTETNVKQLLFAVMTSIAGKKKVFISLNVPLPLYSKYALQLLELLYIYLPYAHRRELGALTFSSKPESKNYLHIIFFEPGTLDAADRSIEKQFIFDVAGGRISGVHLEGRQHEYLDFAMHHFSQATRLEDFFAFAEMALAGLTEEQKLELAIYDQLKAIYRTVTHDDFSVYKNNKLGFLHGLLPFLQVSCDEKPDLVQLFLKLLKEEKLAADQNSALDYIQLVVSIYEIVHSDEALTFILDTLEFYQQDPLFQKLWKIIEQDKFTYQALVMFINEHQNYQHLLGLYLDERVNQLTQVEDMLKEPDLQDIMAPGQIFTIERDGKGLKDVRTGRFQFHKKLFNGKVLNPFQFLSQLVKFFKRMD